ncbi:hypothetical protein [Romboutsia lituseburensis]|uniref:hypothetical protein n=1 Tax=Romboutsia lituseburensis TaxID=1537 RepID=UPI00215B1513|nr:hypothetical protein [Romboutsia lituseburensis]MCR8746988.1 hypothetical protein [Romboutsia lituseburensis]
MKKLLNFLKIIIICLLCVLLGFVVEFGGKMVPKYIFNNQNSSKEGVIVSYINALYSFDAKTAKKCFSPDLNNIKALNYFNDRGDYLARELIELNSNYQFYKKNTPGEPGDEKYEEFIKMSAKIEDEGLINYVLDEKITNLKELYSNKKPDIDIKTEIIAEHDKKNKLDFMKVKFKLTGDNKEIHEEDKEVVVQEKDGKYYIVDIYI